MAQNVKFLCSALFLAGLLFGYFIFAGDAIIPKQEELPLILDEESSFGIVRFSSEKELTDYIAASKELSGESYYGYDLGLGTLSAPGGIMRDMGALDSEKASPQSMPSSEGGYSPSRVSETNVQVLGIDEPDILKTDGNMIYFSAANLWDYRYYEKDIYRGQGKTRIIKAYPPADIGEISGIDKQGEMLLSGNSLVIFSGNSIYGYDVSNPAEPELIWDMELDSSLISSRLHGEKIYIIARNQVNLYEPYPIAPIIKGGLPVYVDYTDIYRPSRQSDASVYYHSFRIDTKTGDIEKKSSFLGSYGSSVFYMSPEAMYITYNLQGDYLAFMHRFMSEKCPDIFPKDVLERMRRVMGYDLSNSAKSAEFSVILGEYMSSLNRDEQIKLRNELSNRMDSYLIEHGRELEKTGIVKLNLDLEVVASGEVPGRLLNQFALDEYGGYLRVASTSGDRAKSANDLYVLDSGLNIYGKIMDFGLEERIYSVRFLGDRGYIVTFREIDPFFVMDLSDPKSPKIEGELKIPGYSSYLHPIGDNLVLGIGKEDSKVKLSLFDVSDPKNPKETSKYMLDEYWSGVLDNHRAFLIDPRHEIFFLPGNMAGYIFSYSGEEIWLEQVISGVSASRALYLDDYLYIIGPGGIAAYDENNWKIAGQIKF
jgi:uncharacterized secreted protein with C-terminal beta-propeller domain